MKNNKTKNNLKRPTGSDCVLRTQSPILADALSGVLFLGGNMDDDRLVANDGQLFSAVVVVVSIAGCLFLAVGALLLEVAK